MGRVALVFAACLGLSAATGLWAQEADSVVPAINPPAASQSVPRLIMLSGTLKDLTGKPLTGPVDLSFAIYKEQADAAPLWQESQTLNLDEQGHYTALLGAMQPEGLPVDLFTSGEARWLGVSAGKLPEQPRVLLVSVPYALKANDAEMLAGKPASAYALAQPAGASTSAGAATAGATAPGGAAASELAAPGKPKSGPKPNLAGTGTQNYIPLWTNGTGTLGNSAIYQSSGLVGIGTTTPGGKLDVAGSVGHFQVDDSGAQFRFTRGGANYFLASTAGGYFDFVVNGKTPSDATASLKLAVNGDVDFMAGKVGIGTITPAHKLDVVGDINASTNINAGGNLSVTGTIAGNGAGLTTLSASNLASGSVPSARISGTYSNALTFSNAGNSFTGSGRGLTNVAAATATTAGGLSCTGCVSNTQLGVNYAASASKGGAASNALLLNGLASSAFQPAGSYAVTTGPNSFTGNQTVSGGSVGIGTAGPVSALNVAGTTGLTWTGGGNNLGLATLGTPGTGGSLYVNTASGSSTYQSGLGIDGTYGTPSLQSVINLKAVGVKSGGGYGSQLAFWTTNGTALSRQMTITNTGNVGIGIATPAQKLDVAGNINSSGNVTATGSVTAASFTGKGSGLTNVTSSGLSCTGCVGNTQLGLKYAGSTLQGGAASNALLLNGLASSAFQPAGSYAVTTGPNSFTGNQTVSGGSVGIGTTGPVSALNVAGTTGLTWTSGPGVNNLGLATFGTPGTGGSLYVNTASGSSTYQSGLGIDGTYGTPSLQSVINLKAVGVKSGGGYGSQLAFWTTDGTALSRQMTITNTGNVGIGIATPAQKLDVAGNINSSGNVTATGSVTAASFTGKGSGLTNVAAATATTASGLSCTGCVSNTQLGVNYAASASKGGAASNALLLNGLASSAFQAAGSYAVTTGPNSFTGTQSVSGGSVGIGTTTPGSPLEVDGSSTSQLVSVTQSGNGNGISAVTASTTSGTGAIAGTATGNGLVAGVAGFYSGNVQGAGVFGEATTASGQAGLFMNTTGGPGLRVENSTGSASVLDVESSGTVTVSGGGGLYAFVVSGNTAINGNLTVSGRVNSGTGPIAMDDPLDPDHKSLYHAPVGSSEMINLYSGNVTTDAHGDAVVELPAWFQALNRDFRYQLTVIGQFAQAIVAQEIENNRFTIKTDKADVRVSWQVTGVRHDSYAKAHPLQVEVDKPERAQ